MSHDALDKELKLREQAEVLMMNNICLQSWGCLGAILTIIVHGSFQNVKREAKGRHIGKLTES